MCIPLSYYLLCSPNLRRPGLLLRSILCDATLVCFSIGRLRLGYRMVSFFMHGRESSLSGERGKKVLLNEGSATQRIPLINHDLSNPF